ncbi:hypothetical protein T06_11804 [Trichinella sp. T6]|nr:hypothetical protein T06_11804 [Trichinella sp. T6]
MLHNGDKKFDMLYCGVSISMDSSLSSQLQSHVSHIVKSFFTVGLAHLPKLNNETLLKTSAVKERTLQSSLFFAGYCLCQYNANRFVWLILKEMFHIFVIFNGNFKSEKLNYSFIIE